MSTLTALVTKQNEARICVNSECKSKWRSMKCDKNDFWRCVVLTVLVLRTFEIAHMGHQFWLNILEQTLIRNDPLSAIVNYSHKNSAQNNLFQQRNKRRFSMYVFSEI